MVQGATFKCLVFEHVFDHPRVAISLSHVRQWCPFELYSSEDIAVKIAGRSLKVNWGTCMEESHAKMGTLLPDDDVSCFYCHIHDYKKGKVKLVAYDCQKLTMVLLAMRLLFSESFHLPPKTNYFRSNWGWLWGRDLISMMPPWLLKFQRDKTRLTFQTYVSKRHVYRSKIGLNYIWV